MSSSSQCQQCKTRASRIACDYCKRVTYCSEKCGTRHWNARHKTECIGKDPSKKVLTLEDLCDRLEKDIPEPSQDEINKMSKQAWHNDVYVRTATYNVLLAQREEVYRQVIIEQFIGDYMTQRGVHPNTAEVIQSELRGIQEDIVNAGVDMLEMVENPKDIGDIIKRTQTLTQVFQREVEKVEPVFVPHEQQDIAAFHAAALEVSFAYAMQMFPIVEIDLVQNDDMTRAHGFLPNPLYEGTEAEVQARIDAGLVEKPDFWDTRFDLFINALDYGSAHELIGMRGRVPRTGGGGKGPPKIVPDLRTYADATAMAETRPNRDVRTRTMQAANGYHETTRWLPQDMWTRLKEIARVLASKECVELFTALGASLSIICGITNMYYYIMEGNPEKINAFREAVKDLVTDVEKAKLQAKLVRLHTEKDSVIREQIVNFMKEHKTEKLHIVPIISRMREAVSLMSNSTLLPEGACALSDQYASELLKDAQNLGYVYMKFRLEAETLPGDIPLVDWLKERMALAQQKMTKPNPTAEDIREFLGVAGAMTSGMVAVTQAGPESTVQDAYETILRAVDKDHRATVEETRRLLDHVKKVGESTDNLVVTSADVVQMAESTSLMSWLQHVASKLRLTQGQYLSLMYVASAIGFGQGFITTYNITNNPVSRAYMERIAAGGSTHFFEYALNSPARFSRAGMFMISNAWTLSWLFDAAGAFGDYVGEPARQWLHAKLQKAMKNKRYEILSVNVAEIFHNAMAGLLVTGPRYVQAFALHGVIFGIGLVYASYMFNTFPLMAHISTAGSIMRNVTGGVVQLSFDSLPAGKAVLSGIADSVISLAVALGNVGRVIVRPDRFDIWSVTMGAGGLAVNVLGAANSMFGLINGAYNTFVMYETLKGFRRSFALHTAVCADANNPGYQDLQDRVVREPETRPKILGYMREAQKYYSMIQLFLVFVALYGVIRHWVSAKAINNKPHWTTYKTRQDRRRRK